MSIVTKKNVQLALACAAILGASAARAAGLEPIVGALGEWKPIVDIRLRYEEVDQTPFVNNAEAGTVRARLGFETGKAWSTALLAEGEFVEEWQGDYNSTVNGKTTFPTVADPPTEEVNRVQLTNTSIDNTTITLGRQRINLDDQRFVGNVGWRMNEQTFDALRVVNKSVANFTIDATYFNQVNRVFGKDSVQGRYHGDSLLGNISYQTKIGKLTGFGYFLKFDPLNSTVAATRNQSLNDSTATYGLRFAGDRSFGAIKLAYLASYAHQTDYGDNLLNFENDYYMGEVTATYRQFSGGVGIELLGGNGVKGFTTPLATLHKFQGWADKFLTTPANGIDDRYVNAGWTKKGVGPFDTISAVASYHTYESERLAIDYGSEVNLSLQAKYQRFTGMLKYADYSEGKPIVAAYRDTTKFWAQIEFVW
jgi:hypothetical protein